jgi:hypothetical protein
MSTLRLPGINATAYSGLTLSGALEPALKGRGLAPSNGSTEKRPQDTGMFSRRIGNLGEYAMISMLTLDDVVRRYLN